MSLTGYITGRDHQAIRTRLKTDFPKPSFPRPHPELKGPPRTKNYGLIGTAFDYLFRFHLEYHNKDTIVCREEWIADRAYEGLAFRFGLYFRRRHVNQTSKKIFRESLEKFRLVRNQFIRAKGNYENFISDGILTDALLEDCLFLAKLDVVFRAGLVAQLFDEHEADDLLDLRKLISVVTFEDFKAIKRCYVNPVFGKASELVGGADCDLILDDIGFINTVGHRVERGLLKRSKELWVIILVDTFTNKCRIVDRRAIVRRCDWRHCRTVLRNPDSGRGDANCKANECG
jgi:hypothetical protein